MNIIITDFDPANPPPLTEDQQQELAKLAVMPDAEIDYSDIPEQTGLQGFHRVNPSAGWVAIDRDILEWIKTLGSDRKAVINQLLRRQMESAIKKKCKLA